MPLDIAFSFDFLVRPSERPHAAIRVWRRTPMIKPHARVHTHTMSDAEECDVCVTTFDARDHAKVVCPYCAKGACRACTEQFVLEHAMEPLCMWCKVGWSPAVLDALLTLKFRRGPLRKQRTRVLLEHERTLLAETQAAANVERTRRDTEAALKDMTALRTAFALAAFEKLRVRAAPTTRLEQHLKDARVLDAVLGSPEAASVAHTGRARAAALDAMSALRTGIEGTPPAIPSLDSVRATARALEDAADAASRVHTALDSRVYIDVCRRVAMETVRLHVCHSLAGEATELRAIANALHAITQHELKRVADAREALHRLGVGVTGQPLTAAAAATAEAPVMAKDEKKPAFACKCPMDGCRGSVLSATWQCGMCFSVVCRTCHEHVASDAHVCDPDVAANVRAIEADIAKGETRRCPSCMSPVSRKFGCNHMWCTFCHTAFDFATGKRIRGHFHNPEHNQWMQSRRGPATSSGPTADSSAADAACVDPLQRAAWTPEATAALSARLMPLTDALTRTMSAADARRTRQQALELVAAHRCCVEVFQMLPTAEYTPETYAKQRIAYLLGELKDDTWEAALVAAEGVRERNGHIRSALEIMLLVGAEEFARIVAIRFDSPRDVVLTTLATTVQSLEAARTYVNEQLVLIRSQFGGSSKLRISDAWSV